jgi:hypothetical protein
MWDIPVIADRKILANQPDYIVLHDKKEKTRVLIDIAVPNDSNNTKDHQQTLLGYKYENLDLEIKNIWKLNNVSIYH